MTLEERVSKLEGASEQVDGRLSDASARQDQAQSEMRAGFGRIDTRIDETNRQLTEMQAETNRQLAEMRAETNRQLTEMRAEMRAEIAEMRAENNRRFEAQDRKLDEMRAEIARLTRFAVGLMVAGVAATGLLITLFQVFG